MLVAYLLLNKRDLGVYLLWAASRIALHSQAECRTALMVVDGMATPRVRTPRGVT